MTKKETNKKSGKAKSRRDSDADIKEFTASMTNSNKELREELLECVYEGLIKDNPLYRLLFEVTSSYDISKLGAPEMWRLLDFARLGLVDTTIEFWHRSTGE